jgi:branched-chain amino acid transport system permease protein
VVGGAAFIPGALLGAGLVTLVNDRLQEWLPLLLGTGGNWEVIVFGVLMVGALQMAPEGIWPHLARRRPGAHATSTVPLPARPPALPRSAPGPVLQAEHLRQQFGGLVAVADVSFSIEAGEILGLIGPNGAGKSTTFNALTGVASPTSGRVRMAGRDVAGWPARRIASLGMARSFQHVKLVASMSVIENVVLGAHLRGTASPLSAVLRRDRAEEAALFGEAARQLARVGLAEHANQPATSLALGQQRIVEIARALCLDPSLLLLDEPAAGLRHAEKQALAALLRRLRAEGMAILLVEHDMDFVMSLADRLVVMDFGTVIAEGEPCAVRANPTVIAAYLGGVA